MSLIYSLLTAGRGLVTDLSTVGHALDAPVSSRYKYSEYDLIIVGGGTAGCVLASRLSENPDIRILLLEAGGSAQGVIFTRIPAAYPLIFRNEQLVYQFYTEPQQYAGGRRRFWPRGRMLGGCSSINAQMAQYGAPADFDVWASICGDDSWNWQNFKKYFTRFESYAPDEKNPNVDLDQRGASGPVRVGYFSDTTQTSTAFVHACQAIGIPYSPDFNVVEGQKGVNRIITYIDDKRERVTSENAYLTPKVLARPNLKVAIHAYVTKILFSSDGSKRATGIEFTNGPNKPVYRATAKREVILSGGAIHSPQILLLSGVGPADQLKEHGVPLIHDLPGVGTHLYDHPVVDINLKEKARNAPIFLRPGFSLSEIFNYIKGLVQYVFFKSGPFTTNMTEAAAFVRSDDWKILGSEPDAELQEAASGPDSPDLELFASAIGYKPHGEAVIKPHSIGLHAVLLRPLSVGRLTLKSASPWDTPVLDPRYFENDADAKRLARGLKLCFKLARTEPLNALLDHETKDNRFDSWRADADDDELERLVRERGETLYHPTSTCRMAPLSDDGVVDSQLRVYGISGLRVCDASIFPSIVSGHTAGAVFAVAEKLADLMKESLGTAVPEE